MAAVAQTGTSCMALLASKLLSYAKMQFFSQLFGMMEHIKTVIQHGMVLTKIKKITQQVFILGSVISIIIILSCSVCRQDEGVVVPVNLPSQCRHVVL